MINKFKYKRVLSLFKAVINGAIYNVDLSTDKETLTCIVSIYERLVNVDFKLNSILVSQRIENINLDILDTLYKFAPQESNINNVMNATILLDNLKLIDNLYVYGNIVGFYHWYINDSEEVNESTSDTAELLTYLIIEANLWKYRKK